MNRQAIMAANGFSPSEFRQAIYQRWTLDASITILLSRYFLRKWRTDVVKSLIREGAIHYEDTRYQVQWVGGKVEATSTKQVLLSFRKAGRDAIPTVLIKAFKESTGS